MPPDKKEEMSLRLLQDMLITQLALAGVKAQDVRKIVRVGLSQVTRIYKLLRKARKK